MRISRFSLRGVFLFVCGIVIGLLGFLFAKSGTLPTSAQQLKQIAFATATPAANACIPAKGSEQVYFVSCGGFF